MDYISTNVEEFTAAYKFPLDQFQLDAITFLNKGKSVLVCAPTGTGKTIVAEYAIWLALQRRQRIIYTTPIKALSNQKYIDLCAQYGEAAVGLVTGDIVQHSRAPIVVLTTEVYRNMLLESRTFAFDAEHNLAASLIDIGFVVFDELHYLGDIERGPVWEEAIIFSPKHIQLIGLSATVGNAEEIVNWISRIHRPIELITHTKRAIPLEHYYYLDKKLQLVQATTGVRANYFPKIGGEAKGISDDILEDVDYEERQPITSKQRRVSEPSEILTTLKYANMLPCLYFLPGRRSVEEAVTNAATHLFTTPVEQTQIQAEIDAFFDQLELSQEDRQLKQVQLLSSLLPRGLAYHHAGLLPSLKILVEMLFTKGYLQVVFATDTLALGLNMPARTVVVGSLSKFDGQEMRLLTPNEYNQLTGRAGRRGMDTQGAAVIPYSPWEPFEESFQRIIGENLPVTSQFVIQYNSILHLWQYNSIQQLRRIYAGTLREYQRYIIWERNEFDRLEKNRDINGINVLQKRRQKIGAYPISRAGTTELDGTISVLRTLEYVDLNNQLTVKGRLLRSIFHSSGILIVELLLLDLLNNVSVNELAEVVSWFVYDNERRLNNKNIVPANLAMIRRQLSQINRQLKAIEESNNINHTSNIVTDFHGIAFAWSTGVSLNNLVQQIDLAEGDILMILNQTIDLLQQIQAAIGRILDARDIQWNNNNIQTSTKIKTHFENLRSKLAQASLLLFRDIIAKSRTAPQISIGHELLPWDIELF